MSETVTVGYSYPTTITGALILRPSEFADCRNSTDLLRAVVERARKEARSDHAGVSSDDIAALWAAVQKLREREG